MGLMTFFALCSNHVGTMRLMALGAKRNFTVNIVAETASQVRVLALDLFQLDDLLSMAGQTLIGDIVCELDDLGCMWIIVAAQAIAKVVVWLTRMALIALGNIVLYHGTMAGMAILATYSSFVGATISSNICRWCGMTLYAIRTAKGGPL